MVETHSFLGEIPWYAWVAIVAIVCGCISSIVKMRHNHAERLALIQQGMHPDVGPDGKPLPSREV